MDTDNLVRMANRIGDFFVAMPDRQEALEGIAQHIKRYWEPRMRRQLLAHLDVHQGAGLDPVILTALQQHRSVVS